MHFSQLHKILLGLLSVNSSRTLGEKEHFVALPPVASRVVRLQRMMSLEIRSGIL
jgi:hypothetical protein